MNPERDLERQIDRALRALPTPAAPESLVPNVMAALAAREERAWYLRPWFEWPLGWRVASAALTIMLLALLTMAAPWAAIPQFRFGGMVRLALPLWKAIAQTWLLYALVAVAGGLAMIVAAVGGAAARVVMKENQIQ